MFDKPENKTVGFLMDAEMHEHFSLLALTKGKDKSKFLRELVQKEIDTAHKEGLIVALRSKIETAWQAKSFYVPKNIREDVLKKFQTKWFYSLKAKGISKETISSILNELK